MGKNADKPTGKELQVTKKVDRLIREFKEVNWNAFIGLSIITSHALDGVRCNGDKELSTVIDVLHELNGTDIARQTQSDNYNDGILQACADLLDNLKLEQKIRDEIGKLKICPRCKGTKHEKGKYKNGVRHDEEHCWEDCIECDGRGVL